MRISDKRRKQNRETQRTYVKTMRENGWKRLNLWIPPLPGAVDRVKDLVGGMVEEYEEDD